MSDPRLADSCAIPREAAPPASGAAPGKIRAAHPAPRTFRHKPCRIGISQMGGNFHTEMAQPLRSSVLPCSNISPGNLGAACPENLSRFCRSPGPSCCESFTVDTASVQVQSKFLITPINPIVLIKHALGRSERQTQCEDTEIFVGRDFSHDKKRPEPKRLQPLKLRRCVSSSNSQISAGAALNCHKYSSSSF